MISDQQRRLPRQTVPTGRLEPEVVLLEGIPDRLLTASAFVGAVEGVFGRGNDTPTDQTLDSPP